MARSLRMRRSNMILILAPDVGDPNFSNILVGLETEASKRGYGVLIGNTQNDPTRETRLSALHQLQPGRRADPAHRPSARSASVRTTARGAAAADGGGQRAGAGRCDVPFVGVDNFEGARIAAEHLISQGHRRIAFIGHSTEPDGQRVARAAAIARR